MKYTKEFERYWARVASCIGSVQPWQSERVKRLAFNAWKAGKFRGADRRHTASPL